jgi:hypothetical protein
MLEILEDYRQFLDFFFPEQLYDTPMNFLIFLSLDIFHLQNRDIPLSESCDEN